MIFLSKNFSEQRLGRFVRERTRGIGAMELFMSTPTYVVLKLASLDIVDLVGCYRHDPIFE